MECIRNFWDVKEVGTPTQGKLGLRVWGSRVEEVLEKLAKARVVRDVMEIAKGKGGWGFRVEEDWGIFGNLWSVSV